MRLFIVVLMWWISLEWMTWAAVEATVAAIVTALPTATPDSLPPRATAHPAGQLAATLTGGRTPRLGGRTGRVSEDTMAQLAAALKGSDAGGPDPAQALWGHVQSWFITAAVDVAVMRWRR